MFILKVSDMSFDFIGKGFPEKHELMHSTTKTTINKSIQNIRSILNLLKRKKVPDRQDNATRLNIPSIGSC